MYRRRCYSEGKFRIVLTCAIFEFALSDTFKVREIYQDNPIAGEFNHLYVRFSYDVPISGGSTITISNLANANAISARLLSTMSPLKSGDISAAPLLSCSGSPFSGCWTQGATPLQTSLTMTVAAGAVNTYLARFGKEHPGPAADDCQGPRNKPADNLCHRSCLQTTSTAFTFP
jgi:hypothetical protein